VLLVRDCKLKFQQLQRKEDALIEFSKEEGSEDLVKTIAGEKEKILGIILRVSLLPFLRISFYLFVKMVV
jgi:hypothetical protein